LQLNKVTLNHLLDKSNEELLEKNELLSNFKAGLAHDISILEEKIASLVCDETEKNDVRVYHHHLKEVFAIQRNELARLRKEKLFSDQILRKHAERIDLSEAQIFHNH
jgi:CPA1 family monovalent cation:H+ antiporter